MIILTKSDIDVSYFWIWVVSCKLPILTMRPLIILGKPLTIIYSWCWGIFKHSYLKALTFLATCYSCMIWLTMFLETFICLKCLYSIVAASFYCFIYYLLILSCSFCFNNFCLSISFLLPILTLYLKSSWKNLSILF